ncbi:hypothetical protein FRC07_001949 [Ceratobasidium sp. 392]|nr:hypothetical protein FRC07_001949 [Ceratobasidium sp. 392]
MSPPTLTLKQRLAALATNAQSRADSPLSSSTRGLSFPSPRSPHHEFGPLDIEEQYEGMRAEERDAVDKAVSGIITQAGVDYETRPMVVVTASAFPDPRQISYDILLSRILAYLDLYVENDYVVVFLAAGGRHTPSWNWIWKAYRGLSRNPKFFRKITYVSTLSELARYVPLTQIDIAPAVYKDLPEPIFSGTLYPLIARCPPSTGWGVDGLAPDPRGKPTTTPSHSPLMGTNGRAAKGHARIGSEAELATVGGWGEGDACVEYIREVLLPAMGWGCRVMLLGYIFHILHDVSMRSEINKMDAHNLALCIAPNLVRSQDPVRDVKICTVPPSAGALQMSPATWNTPGSAAPSTPAPPRRAGTTTLGEIVKICIERYFEIFEDMPDRGEALPVPSELRFDSASSSGIGLSGLSPTVSRSSFSGSTSLDGPSETSAAMDSSFSTLDSVPRSSVDIEDDELNEAMLVMSVAPDPAPARPSPSISVASAQPSPVPYATYSRASKAGPKSAGALPPSSWSKSPKMGHSSSTPMLPGSLSSPSSPVMPRHRRTPSSGSTTHSSPFVGGPTPTIRGARSVISIERKAGRKGSIALGRSGTGAGSGVAAMGVTATGFFERPT